MRNQTGERDVTQAAILLIVVSLMIKNAESILGQGPHLNHEEIDEY